MGKSSCSYCYQVSRDLKLHSDLYSSKFGQLQATNDPMKDAELGQIKNVVLPLLNRHLGHVESHSFSSNLDHHRGKELDSLISKYEFVSSSQRLIPTEILWQIFHICSDSKMEFSGRTSRIMSAGPTSSAWKLAQVSRRWRSAALSCGPIWSSFTLRLVPSYAMSPHSIHILETVLDRSAQSPLTIVLETISTRLFPGHRWDRNVKALQAQTKLVDLVYSQAHRWQSVTLNLEQASDVEQLMSSVTESLPMLEKLALSFEEEPADADFLYSFADCPRLTEVRLRGIQTAQVMAMARFPWRQITKLAIATSHTSNLPVAQFAACLQILEKCTAVKIFSFAQHCFARDATYITANPVILPSLEELHTTDSLIFNNLSLPALRIIKAGSKYRESDADLLAAIDALIARSNCSESVARIELTAFPIRGILLQILQRTNNLEHLSLKGICDIDDQSKTEIGIITRFIGSMKVSEELPKLKDLYVSDKNELVKRIREW